MTGEYTQTIGDDKVRTAEGHFKKSGTREQHNNRATSRPPIICASQYDWCPPGHCDGE